VSETFGPLFSDTSVSTTLRSCAKESDAYPGWQGQKAQRLLMTWREAMLVTVLHRRIKYDREIYAVEKSAV
jgi:hypothetical protein